MRSQTFSDFDEFAASVRDVDSKMMLRSPERHVWSTSSVDVHGIDVQLGRLGSGNIAQGQLRPDGYMLYLPLTDGVAYSANGSVLPEQSFAILEPGCEFCISTKVAHDWCVAFVPSTMLARVGEPGGAPSGSQKMTCRVTPPNRQAAHHFRAIVHQIMSTAAKCSYFESTRAATHAATKLLEVADLVLGSRRVVEPLREGRPKVRRQGIIRLATEFLEQSGGRSVKVGELAAAAQVSERTLRTAFHEYFGVGPRQYLQLKQLYKIHRALKAADCAETTVSQILIEHGEWAFSRCASRYRRLFGKLPSETLRAKRPL